MKPFQAYFAAKQKLINQQLNKLLTKENIPQLLKKAMNYSLKAGGKRLRAALVLMVDDLFRQKFDDRHSKDILNIAVSLECIHTYSLIHDDLPCMDDDDLRRGKATCHIKFDEATAILAGDALLTMAFELIGRLQISPNNLRKIIKFLAKSAGASGMVGGQILDMQSENKKLSLAQMKKIHRLKTGALIEASVILPALFNDANKSELLSLKQYSQFIGMSFQIVDDILDITGTSEELGKTAKSDLTNNKSTYVSLLGLKKAQKKAVSVVKKSKVILNNIHLNTEYLASLSDYILDRKS